MAKSKLSLDKRRDIFLHGTKVENLFISEYLPDAPGEYVKVYLFGLMYAQYDVEPNRQELSKLLGLSVEEIEEAWIYWESKGLVRKACFRDENGEEVNHVIFLSQVEALYGRPRRRLPLPLRTMKSPKMKRTSLSTSRWTTPTLTTS